MQVYELPNGDRTTRFTGERVAHATSRNSHGAGKDALRWTEVDVYRTVGGKYVLHKVGKSRVYCAEDDASDTSRKLNVMRLFRDDPDKAKELAPCPVCKPGPLSLNAYVWLETDRGTVHVSDSARGLVEAAHSTDEDGVTFMTKTAERALRQLAQQDDAVREAFMVEEVL